MHRFIISDFSPKEDKLIKDYEMPYYRWEADLDHNGNKNEDDGVQATFFKGFKGFLSLAELTPDENKNMVHERMRK